MQAIGYLVAAMLIGYGLFSEDGIYYRFVSPPTQTVAKSQTNSAATSAAPVYELTKTRIADIKVGTRVPAFDPQLGTEIRESFAEPNWAQWIKLNLEMTKSDGSLLKMEMLRHEDWVLENIAYEFLDDEDLKATSLLTAANSSQFIKSLPLETPQGPLRPLFAELLDVRSMMSEVEAESVLMTISLDLPEIGVRGEAVVTGVDACPVILPGPGKVVLTTFHHASSDLIDLYLSPQPLTGANSLSSHSTFQTSEESLLYPQASRSTVVDQSWERIGVTGNHPIWSEDRHDYIAAMDLRVGERLKNLSGDTVYVQQKLPRPGPTPVYNLEVQDEHVYYVGASGVLAHNSNGCDPPSSGLTRGANPSRLTFEGMEVRAVRDLSHVDDSTLKAMAQHGFAAKDINGNKLILHHLDQNVAGPIVEMPGVRHSIHNSVQHPLGNAPGVGLTTEQRAEFNVWRERYWKARAARELAKRGL